MNNTEDKPSQCLFCMGDLQSRVSVEGEVLTIRCKRCGTYYTNKQNHESMKQRLRDWRQKRHIISANLRAASNRSKPIHIDHENFENLLESPYVPNTPFDMMDQILLYCCKRSEKFTSDVAIRVDDDYPLFYAKDSEELNYVLSLSKRVGYLDYTSGSIKYKLTAEGWKYAIELRKKKPDSRQAFVAMWFDEQEMKGVYENGLKPALDETGFIPIRIDLIQHNDKIDDRIIAEIRKSALLVADLTGVRGGVYFEAGFAMGLGITVIWTCRKDFLDEIHFDTQQYNYISWEKPDELKKKLKDRIEALGL